MHNIKSMFYAGHQPWHKLGVKVDGALTSEEAIKKAGLDYEVEKVPVTFEFKGNIQTVDDKFVTVRADSGIPLGVVGKVYSVLQNKNAFRFIDGLVGIKEQAIYHTAGALGQGERIWLLAKLPGYIRTLADDVTEKYLLLSNSHDGSSAVEILWTPIRVVCQNTLNIAIENATNKIALRHTSSIGLKLDDAREALGIASQRFQLLEDLSQKLAKVRFDSKQLVPLMKESGVIPNLTNTELSPRSKNLIEEISRLFEVGRGAELEGSKGTAWGAWNAIVEHVDFYRGKTDETRASSLLFGSGAKIKQKAWERVVALL